jgi:hypothetical protein
MAIMEKLPEKYEAEKQDLLAKHKSIRTLIVPLDEDDDSKVAILFLRKPDRTTRNMVWTLVGKSDTDKAIIACIKALYIGGDSIDLITGNGDAMDSVDGALSELLKVQRTVIKKN